MLNFLRKLRRKNFKGNYLKYAIGEIFLVVIGILIALSLNNWNAARKDQNRIKTYKRLMVGELKQDLRRLEFIQAYNDSIGSLISNYLIEYNANVPNVEKLKKMKITDAIIVNTFNKNSLTIDEVADNGSLSLFSPELKQAIVRLKDWQDLSTFYERESLLRVIRSIDQLDEHIDLLYEKGYSTNLHPTATQWYEDLTSVNYRHVNNALAKTLDYYDYQEDIIFKRLKELTNNLLVLLEEQ